MAIRKDIVWTVADDGSVTPTTPQDGGVQGEHHATRAVYRVGSVWENKNFTVYIECEDSAGNVDATEPLQVEGGQVSVLLPLAWTQYGGMSTLRLVAEEQDGTVAMTAEGLVRYDSRQNASQKVDGLLKTRLSGVMEAAKVAEAAATNAAVAASSASGASDAAKQAAASAATTAEGAAIAAASAKQSAEEAKAAAEKLPIDTCEEYALAICDKDGNVVLAVDHDGKVVFAADNADVEAELQKLRKAMGGKLDKLETSEYAYAVCDEQGNMVFAITNDGEVLPKQEDGGTTTVVSGSAVDFTKCGLPVLYLNGDLNALEDVWNETGERVEGDFTYKFKTAKGTQIVAGDCTVKFQGSSSVSRGYPKRNFTIKSTTGAFDATSLWPYDKERVTNFPNEDGAEVWGQQTKYCAKANWIDPSHVRNVACARLWASIVKDRAEQYGNVPEKLLTAPNCGAIDGFPCIIALNGEFWGLYTFNIPKDDWTFNMGDGVAEYLVAGENNGKTACGFTSTPTFVEDASGNVDFAIEYIPDGVAEGTLIASFQEAVNAVKNSSASADWETEVEQYFDVASAIDYLIFVCCIGARDNLRKNALYGTYDGVKWFMSAYDLDTTFGANVHAKGWYPVVNDRNQFKEACDMHRVFERIYNYSTAKLVKRYDELRSTILSDENVWYVLQNFANDIPKAVYNMDAEKWTAASLTRPLLGSTTANVENYMHYYRMHCAYLDKEIEALREKEV